MTGKYFNEQTAVIKGPPILIELYINTIDGIKVEQIQSFKRSPSHLSVYFTATQ